MRCLPARVELSKLFRLGVLAGTALMLVSCEFSPFSSASGNPLSSLGLRSGDLPAGFARCDRLSGEYPKVAGTYLNPGADGTAWQFIQVADAADAWVEIYGRGSGVCDRYQTATDPMATSGGLVQAMVIGYRTPESALKAFESRRFIPAVPAGSKEPSATVLYGTPVHGTASGLGPESYVNAGAVGAYTFLHAALQRGQYVLTLFAENVPADVARQLLPVLSGRLRATTPATSAPAACNGPGGGGTGSISGDQLSYPGPGVPALRIYAIRLGGSNGFCMTTTVLDQRSYTISGLPVGQYNVIAYRASGLRLAGGYTKAVPCGLSASCTDHALLAVVVQDGQAVTGINPNDWYPSNLPVEPHS